MTRSAAEAHRSSLLGINLHKRSACIHLHIPHGHYMADFSGKRSEDLHLHFHGLQHQQAVSGRDRIPGFHGDGNHDRRRGSMDDASVVAIDFVGNAVDLDAIAGALDGRDNVKSSTEDSKPIFETGQGVPIGLAMRDPSTSTQYVSGPMRKILGE